MSVQTETLLQRTFDSLPIAIAGMLFDGSLLQYNPAFCRLLGYAADELHNSDFLALVHADDRPRHQALSQRLAAGECEHQVMQTRLVARDGSVLSCKLSVGLQYDAQGRAIGMVGVIEELTPRNPAEAALSESQSLRRIAGQAARLGGWAIDLDQRKLMWSDEVCAIHDLPPGYTPTLAEGLAYYPPEVRSDVQRYMEACVMHGTPYDFELPKLTASGRRIWVRSIGEAVRDENGRTIRLQGAFQDITTHKHVEQRLIEQAALLDNANDAITVSDMNWRITYWNKAAERLYGWSAAEVEGRRLHEILQVDGALIQASERSLRASGVWKGELHKTTRQGKKLTIQASWTLLQDEQGKPKSILTIDSDMTGHRQIEEQFRQSQKMEAIGRLAGGIAHDFNNLLTVINGYSESLLDLAETESRLQEPARMINKAGIRAADLTRQLLGFSRQALLQPKVLDLNILVLDTGTMLSRLIGANIQFNTILNPAPSRIKVDPGQMDQVLMNLVINARDAMPAGGTLTIETANVELDEEFALLHPGCKPGAHVLLAVTDTGVGMPPDVSARMFEPFFTTKELGKGSGLGLALVFGIIQQSDGWIQVSSEPGLGTTFRIYLPAIAEPVDPPPAADLPPP